MDSLFEETVRRTRGRPRLSVALHTSRRHLQPATDLGGRNRRQTRPAASAGPPHPQPRGQIAIEPGAPILAQLPAISCFGASRTPAVGARAIASSSRRPRNLHSSGRHAKAWLMSAIRSSGCSIPIDMRTNDGVIPISRRACSVSPECTVVVGWQIKDSVPPRLTANLNT
jgi:hypothetical protein